MVHDVSTLEWALDAVPALHAGVTLMQVTGRGRPAEALAAAPARSAAAPAEPCNSHDPAPEGPPQSRNIAAQGAAKAAKPSAAPQADLPPPLPVRWLDFEKVGLFCPALACPGKQLPWGRLRPCSLSRAVRQPPAQDQRLGAPTACMHGQEEHRSDAALAASLEATFEQIQAQVTPASVLRDTFNPDHTHGQPCNRLVTRVRSWHLGFNTCRGHRSSGADTVAATSQGGGLGASNAGSEAVAVRVRPCQALHPCNCLVCAILQRLPGP